MSTYLSASNYDLTMYRKKDNRRMQFLFLKINSSTSSVFLIKCILLYDLSNMHTRNYVDVTVRFLKSLIVYVYSFNVTT